MRLRLREVEGEGQNAEVMAFVENSLDFMQLEKKIREYPRRAKKLLKN